MIKTRKELERDIKEVRIIIGLMLIGVLILGFYGIYKGIRVEQLETQLSECQDKIPIWTLKINCQDIDLPIFFDAYVRVNITNIGFNLSAEFEDYEDYQDALSSFKELNEYCEIIK